MKKTILLLALTLIGAATMAQTAKKAAGCHNHTLKKISGSLSFIDTFQVLKCRCLVFDSVRQIMVRDSTKDIWIKGGPRPNLKKKN